MTYVDSYGVNYTFDAAAGVTASNQATAATNALAAAQQRQANASKAQAAAFQTAASAARSAGGSFGNRASGKGSFGNPGTVSSNPFATVGGPQTTVTKVGTGLFTQAKQEASEFFGDVESSAKQLLQGLKSIAGVVGSIFGVGVAGAVGAVGLMKEAANFDALKMSLRAFDGKNADPELGRLRNIGKAPGLGFEGAVNAYTGLRNADFDPQSSERIIREVANANARGGGNNESFQSVMMHLREIASQPFANERNIRGISNDRIPINRILQEQFGTASTEELKAKGITSQKVIQGLVDGLSKLERVAGSERTQFDNIGDAIHNAEVAAGEGLNKGLLPYVNEFETAVEHLTDGGEIEAAFQSAAEIIKTAIGGDTEGGAEDVLREILVGVRDVATLTANVVENTGGFAKWVKDTFSFSNKKADVDFRRKAGIGGDSNDDFDYSPSASHERNEADSEADRKLSVNRRYRAAAAAGAYGDPKQTLPGSQREFAQNYKDPEYQRYLEAVENKDAQPGTWAAWKAAHKGGSTSATGKSGSSGTTASAPDRATPLLERIAVATEKQVDMQTQLQGGSTEAKNVTSAYGRRNRGGKSGGHWDMLMDLGELMDRYAAAAESQSVINQRGRMRGA